MRVRSEAENSATAPRRQNNVALGGNRIQMALRRIRGLPTKVLSNLLPSRWKLVFMLERQNEVQDAQLNMGKFAHLRSLLCRASTDGVLPLCVLSQREVGKLHGAFGQRADDIGESKLNAFVAVGNLGQHPNRRASQGSEGFALGGLHAEEKRFEVHVAHFTQRCTRCQTPR